MHFFRTENIFFEILGYAVSYLEFFATIISVACVILSAQASVWNWPLAIISSLLTVALFYQVQLYPDMFLQIFFCFMAVVGWWRWKHPSINEADQNKELQISWMGIRELVIGLIVGLSGTFLLGHSATHFHEWWPLIFNKPSASPYLDSFITIMSVLTTYLVIQKKIESWILWIIIDLVATYLYYIREIKLYSVLYFLFCIIATFGLAHWIKVYKGYARN